MSPARTLRPCEARSCVSTQAPLTHPLRRIEPLRFATPGAVALRAVMTVLSRTPRLRILERDDAWVHAIGRSALLRIPHDLEVMIDDRGGRIHLRVSTSLAIRERASSRVRAEDLLRRIDAELRSLS
jgi:uncharacterized protein (DUF1499 family)